MLAIVQYPGKQKKSCYYFTIASNCFLTLELFTIVAAHTIFPCILNFCHHLLCFFDKHSFQRCFRCPSQISLMSSEVRPLQWRKTSVTTLKTASKMCSSPIGMSSWWRLNKFLENLAASRDSSSTEVVKAQLTGRIQKILHLWSR